MARSNYQFQKRQKEMERKKKKELKRQQKLEKKNPPEDPDYVEESERENGEVQEDLPG